MEKRELLKYIGDFSQLFGTKEYTLHGGKAAGVRAIDVRNGLGLEFTVLPDRGMDFSSLSFKGINLSYISKTGIVAPQYYNEESLNFFRSFFAGFLTTCGLSNVGSPNMDSGEKYGLHGRISNIPSEDVSARTEWINNRAVMKIYGKMREAKFFGENIVLEREIKCLSDKNIIKISDKVENLGFKKEPLMLLYHFNFGYPLLDENAYLKISSEKIVPRDEEAKVGIDEYTKFQEPTANYDEQVFYHDLKADFNGKTSVSLINDKINLGVVIRFNKNQLFNLVEWKQMGEGEYVLGLEPSNCYVGGRQESRKENTLEYLEPGEEKKIEIEIEVLEG